MPPNGSGRPGPLTPQHTPQKSYEGRGALQLPNEVLRVPSGTAAPNAPAGGEQSGPSVHNSPSLGQESLDPKKTISKGRLGTMSEGTLSQGKVAYDSNAAKQSAQVRHSGLFRAKALDCISLDTMAAETDVVRRDIFRQVLAKQRRNANGCVTLPGNIAFFVLYSLAARLHEDITNVWLLESAMRHEFQPPLAELKSIHQVAEWLEHDVVENFFVQRDSYGVLLPPEEWSRVLLYSQVQGSLVLTQTRDNAASWGRTIPPPYADNLTASLVAQNYGFIPKSAGGRRRLEEITPSLHDYLPQPSSVDEDQTYEVLLYPTMPVEDIRSVLHYLHDRQWIDDHTSTLTLRVLLLNGELGRPRLEQFLIELAFSRGGGIWNKVTLEALFLESFPNLMSKAADVLWLLMLLTSTFLYSGLLWQSFETSQMYRHVTSFVTLLEWVIVIAGWANVLGFILQTNRTETLSSSLQAVRDIRRGINEAATAQGAHSAGASVSGAYEAASADLHLSAEQLIEIMRYWRTGLAWYNIILIFRFFVAFRAQPRLAIVTNTLSAVMMDLAHFLVIFTPSFLAYAISGNLLFGRRIESFSTLQGAIGVCLRITFENEFEWILLSHEQFWLTAAWVWSFLLVISIIMLNLVLAIILDIYNEVRANTDSADTMFRFMAQLMTRLYHYRRWVKDTELEGILDDMSDFSSITRQDLVEMIPRMTEMQRQMLFTACKVESSWRAKQDIQKTILMKLVASIKLSIDDANMQLKKARESMEELAVMEQEPPNMPSRMQGTSRPFPSMPPTPGGYFPPMLAPPSGSPDILLPMTDESTDPQTWPPWYAEMKVHLASSCELMASIQWQVQHLQWQWYQTEIASQDVAVPTNAVTAVEAELSQGLMPVEAKADKQKRSAMHVPIL